MLPQPSRFLRTSWSRDPFALGSYSYLPPNPLGACVRAHLAESVGGRVHFAGEATSAQAPATTTGALLSGRRAAREILETAREGQSATVVGAGFAGLACARKLAKAGLRVSVLEARERVGGRAWTTWVDGMPAELGASWIHGYKGNRMTKVLRRSGGRALPFDYDNAAGRDRAALRELERLTKDMDDRPDADTAPISAVLPPDPSPALRSAANMVYAQEYGAEPHQLSITADEEGVGGRGGDLLLPDGYDRLVERVRGGLPVRTGAVVTGIGYDTEGTSVRLRSGEEVPGDYCVVTLPLGVLKSGSVTFTPELPEDKRAAVDTLGMGLLDKLWLWFPEVFWDADADTIEWSDPEESGLWSFWVNGYKAFGRPVLLGFNGGDQAHRVAELTDEQAVQSAMSALRRIHG